MTTQTDPSAAPRLPLSRERVLRAAVSLADEAGIGSLSMRRLGQELGVEAMSLYNHVKNKEEILDGMVELVVGEIDLSSDGADWKAALRDCVGALVVAGQAAQGGHTVAPTVEEH